MFWLCLSPSYVKGEDLDIGCSWSLNSRAPTCQAENRCFQLVIVYPHVFLQVLVCGTKVYKWPRYSLVLLLNNWNTFKISVQSNGVHYVMSVFFVDPPASCWVPNPSSSLFSFHGTCILSLVSPFTTTTMVPLPRAVILNLLIATPKRSWENTDIYNS